MLKNSGLKETKKGQKHIFEKRLAELMTIMSPNEHNPT